MTPLPSRSKGSSSASSVSSAIASTRPAPNTGIGARRATTFTSAGMTGWQVCCGTENRCISVLPDVSSASKAPAASRYAARVSSTRLVPPIAGTLWQAAQLVALNAGPSPSSAVSTSVKSSRPRRNSVNSVGVIPGNRVAQVHGAVLPAADQRRRDRRDRPDPEPDTDPLQCCHLRLWLADGLSHDQLAPHEIVAGAAHARALERVAARFRRAERNGNFASATLWDHDVDAGAGDAEPVRGVVAADAQLDLLAGVRPRSATA